MSDYENIVTSLNDYCCTIGLTDYRGRYMVSKRHNVNVMLSSASTPSAAPTRLTKDFTYDPNYDYNFYVRFPLIKRQICIGHKFTEMSKLNITKVERYIPLCTYTEGYTSKHISLRKLLDDLGKMSAIKKIEKFI